MESIPGLTVIRTGDSGAMAAEVVQPLPVKNEGPCVQDLVIADIETRKKVGREKYGTLLQPFNGRDALVDAYQEALDLCQYLRQAIEERDEIRRGADPLAHGVRIENA
jgi:hypothetical protein